MLKLVLLSLMAAAVLALPTFPDLHQQPEKKDAVIETTKVTQFIPGQEPKQFSEVRLLEDGESIPIERHQSRRQALDVDLSRRPGQKGLQGSEQESSVFRMPAKFEENSQHSSPLLERQQSKRQTDASEDANEKRLPENDELAVETKEDNAFEPVARISILRTVIIFLNPVKSDEGSEGVQSTDETQAELTKPQSEQLENLEQPIEQQPPELYESPSVDVQKRQTEQARIPTSQSGLLFERQQQEQQQQQREQQPQLRIRKRRQVRNPPSFQTFSSNVEMPNIQRQHQPGQLGGNLGEEHKHRLPLERNTRNIFEPAPSSPKLPRQERQELLKQTIDVRDRLKDQLPSRRVHVRSIVPHHVGSQDPSPLMKAAETNREEKMMPQQETEPSDRLQPYIEQLESLIGFMEKTKEHIEHEAHHLHSSDSRKKREEPFPSVLIPPRLVEQKENIEQTENEPEMKENVRETPPVERPAEPLPELPEEKAQPPIQEKKAKELELPREEKDFREVLESTPHDALEKGKQKAQDIKQPVEEKFDQGKEKLGDLSENLKPDEVQRPVSDVVEQGREKASEGEENIERNLPDVDEMKESLPDIEKGDRESHGKSLDVEQSKPDQAELPTETPMAPEVPEETPRPTEAPVTPEVVEQGPPQPEDVRRGKELAESDVQSPREETQDLPSGKQLGSQEERPSEGERMPLDEDERRAGKNILQPEISKPLEGEQISLDDRRGKERAEIEKPMDRGEGLRRDQDLERGGKEFESREESEIPLRQEDVRRGKELSQPDISESNVSEEESDELRVNPSESSFGQSNVSNENIENVQQQPEELSSSLNQPAQQSIEGKHLTRTLENIGGEDETPEAQGDEVTQQQQPSPIEVHSKHQQQKEMSTGSLRPAGNQEHRRNKRTFGYYPYRRWPYYRRRYGYPLFLGAGIFPGLYGGGYYGGGMYGGGMYGGGMYGLDVAADVDYGGYGDYGGGFGDYGGGFGDYGGGFGDYGGGFGDYGGGDFGGIDY